MSSQLSSEERCGSRKHTAVLEVMAEAETGVMLPQAEVPRKLQEVRKDCPAASGEGVSACASIWAQWSRCRTSGLQN